MLADGDRLIGLCCAVLLGHLVRARAPQVMTGLLMGSVALVCFGLVFALLTGKLPTLIARVRSRLAG